MNNDRLNMLLGMLQEDNKDSFVRYAVAKEYENMGQQELAINHFLEIQQNDPNYVGMYYHLAKLYEAIDDITKALATYATGIAIATKIPDFHALSELNSAKLNLEMDL